MLQHSALRKRSKIISIEMTLDLFSETPNIYLPISLQQSLVLRGRALYWFWFPRSPAKWLPSILAGASNETNLLFDHGLSPVHSFSAWRVELITTIYTSTGFIKSVGQHEFAVRLPLHTHKCMLYLSILFIFIYFSVDETITQPLYKKEYLPFLYILCTSLLVCSLHLSIITDFWNVLTTRYFIPSCNAKNSDSVGIE